MSKLEKWEEEKIKDLAQENGFTYEEANDYIHAFWQWVSEKIENEYFKPNMTKTHFNRAIRKSIFLGGATLKCVWEWYQYVNSKRWNKERDEITEEIFIKNEEKKETLKRENLKRRSHSFERMWEERKKRKKEQEDLKWYND